MFCDTIRSVLTPYFSPRSQLPKLNRGFSSAVGLGLNPKGRNKVGVFRKEEVWFCSIN